MNNFIYFKSIFTSKSLIHRRWVSKCVRIGCASGFWGDTSTAVRPLVMHGKLNYLVFDYLSEITMSILAVQKSKSADMGYTPDFVNFAMAPNLKEIKEQGIKVISNAGGINPQSCASALHNIAKQQGIDLNIYIVTGDNLMPQKEEIQKLGIKEMKSGADFPTSMHSMNAYLGAGPIAQALEKGADVVITGRCVDSAVTLAPLISTFKWRLDDWDKLASGSLAGHLIECGAQSTGGIHTDWHQVPNWDNMGFPIVECYEDGSFELTKPDHTGGIVTVGTASEQLLYEIGDPFAYHLPDVICDFTEVNISQVKENVVFVKGAKGRRPSDFYKVSATFSDGYRATAVCPVIGRNAKAKALKTGNSILQRSEMLFKKLKMKSFRRTNIEIIGSEQNYGENSKIKDDSREVMMWVAVHHDQREAIGVFAKEIAAAATGAAPGLTTLVGGRPSPSPILKLFSFLYPKNKVKIEVTGNEKTEEYVAPQLPDPQPESSSKPIKRQDLPTGSHQYHLSELAFTRSGDKGDTCNIGVIARHPAFLPYIEKYVTEETVSKYFHHLFEDHSKQNVKRYYLPGVYAFNFVMENALGGGGVASLRTDPQGKACGQMLADFPINNMPQLDTLLKKYEDNKSLFTL